MALYDPVDGVYRKVAKKYDPVSGIYRSVAKAFDPVDGVYRQYFSSGLKWIKYEAYRIYSYTVSDWVHVSTEPVEDGVVISGYNGYLVSPNGEPGNDYAYDPGSFGISAPYKQITAPDTGEVYVYRQAEKIDRIRLIAAADGGTIRDIYTKTITNTFLGYENGAEIGSVYAAEGEYPDAENGYTYLTTTSDGYVIMMDSAYNYYAYKIEEE